MSDSSWPHGLQHTRLPCPSTPGAYSNSCPSSQWCHLTISSSVVPFFSHLQSFPASGSFPMNRLFTSGSQSIGALSSAFPMNIQGWFPLGLTGWVSLQSKRLSGSMVENLSARAGCMGSVPGWGRFPGEEHGNPLQYSCLENPVDRGAWWATVYGVAKELDTT